jgi:glutaredoxin 2
MRDKNKYKPDLTAPRFTSKTLNAVSRTSFLKHFRKKHPEFSHLTEPEIRNIIKTFNETIVEQVIDCRYGVDLPEFTGRLFIGSCRKKHKPNVDFKKTAYSKQTIQHRNFESDDYLAKIFYTTYDIKHAYKNSNLYSFKACRNFTRMVGRTYPIHWKKYILIEPFKKLTGLFKQNISKLERQDRTEEYIKTYDEFDF